MILATLVARQWVRRLRLRQKDHQRKLISRARGVEKLAQVGTLTGHLAHEIRNPLSTVKVNLQLLSEDISRQSKALEGVPESPGNDAQNHTYQRQLRKIETIGKEVDRLSHTLNDFLRYAGRMEVHPGRYDINEILDDLIDFYEPQALAKDIHIRRSLSKAPAVCRVDKDLLKQAFLNLFINATQVIPEGGELIIRSTVQAESVLVEVIDTGPGIPESEREKVFDPYYTTRTGGTGLGLPTCRRVIEEHNGHIELQSESGKGTRFTIELPLMDYPV